MNESLRFPIAILVSLSLHIALLSWAKVPAPHGHGPLQVFLRNSVAGQEALPVQAPASANATLVKNPEARHEKVPTEAPALPPPVFQNQQAFSKQASMMNGMQLAQQRELRRAAIRAQMSEIVARLRPLVSTSIICEQQKGGGIDCMPEPEGRLLPLLEQFSRVANEAHQLDITGNPARIDFGDGQGVSVKLTNP